jgi:hypothetical protein
VNSRLKNAVSLIHGLHPFRSKRLSREDFLQIEMKTWISMRFLARSHRWLHQDLIDEK